MSTLNNVTDALKSTGQKVEVAAVFIAAGWSLYQLAKLAKELTDDAVEKRQKSKNEK